MSEMERVEPDPADRQAFRAWVRASHPDLGGDPDEFVAGLARWRPGGAVARNGAAHGGPAAAARVTAFRARHGWWLVDRWWRRRVQRRKSGPMRSNGKVSGRVR
jgi:hypothetical protein